MNTRLLMTLEVHVATPQNIGPVPHGTRRTVPITGGNFKGPRLGGTVLAEGSADWLLLRGDGCWNWTCGPRSRRMTALSSRCDRLDSGMDRQT